MFTDDTDQTPFISALVIAIRESGRDLLFDAVNKKQIPRENRRVAMAIDPSASYAVKGFAFGQQKADSWRNDQEPLSSHLLFPVPALRTV